MIDYILHILCVSNVGPQFYLGRARQHFPPVEAGGDMGASLVMPLSVIQAIRLAPNTRDQWSHA